MSLNEILLEIDYLVNRLFELRNEHDAFLAQMRARIERRYAQGVNQTVMDIFEADYEELKREFEAEQKKIEEAIELLDDF